MNLLYNSTYPGRVYPIAWALACLLYSVSALAPAQAQTAQGSLTKNIGIDQNLSAQIPLGLTFKDDTGKTVRLQDYFGKRPVILTLIFYQCKGSCVLELEGALKCFKGLKTMSIGKDFDVLTVSIHPKETPDLAAAKKQLALSLYGRPGAESGWHFLVGDMLNIQSLTRTVGFRYTYDPATDAIAHPTGIIILTPQGRVSRYFFGVNYASSLVRQAVLDAATNKIGVKAEPILMGCLQYDPKTGKYRVLVEGVLRVAGLLTVLILGTYVGGMLYYERRARHKDLRVEP